MYRSHTFATSYQGSAIAQTARSAALPAILLTLALLLSACAQAGKNVATYDGVRQPSKKPAHGVMVPTPAASANDTADAGDADKTGTADTPVPDTEAAAAPATDPIATLKAAPATIWRSADKLLGLAAEELQAALGAPARIRDEETGRIYQYVGSDCVLDLFLYQEAAGSYRVSYAEARSINAEKKPVDTCLKSLPAPIVADNTPSS